MVHIVCVIYRIALQLITGFMLKHCYFFFSFIFLATDILLTYFMAQQHLKSFDRPYWGFLYLLQCVNYTFFSTKGRVSQLGRATDVYYCQYFRKSPSEVRKDIDDFSSQMVTGEDFGPNFPILEENFERKFNLKSSWQAIKYQLAVIPAKSFYLELCDVVKYRICIDYYYYYGTIHYPMVFLRPIDSFCLCRYVYKPFRIMFLFNPSLPLYLPI